MLIYASHIFGQVFGLPTLLELVLPPSPFAELWYPVESVPLEGRGPF
jgi:hypothetical protein